MVISKCGKSIACLCRILGGLLRCTIWSRHRASREQCTYWLLGLNLTQYLWNFSGTVQSAVLCQSVSHSVGNCPYTRLAVLLTDEEALSFISVLWYTLSHVVFPLHLWVLQLPSHNIKTKGVLLCEEIWVFRCRLQAAMGLLLILQGVWLQ